MSARSSRGISAPGTRPWPTASVSASSAMVLSRGRRARSIDRADLDALNAIRSRCGAHAVAEIDRHARPADGHGPARLLASRGAAAATRAAAWRANPPDRQGRRSPRSAPPAASTLDATSSSSGPQPARTMRRPGSMPCDLIRMVAAARPITPGSVQPGNGTTRSCAPVAAISRGAVKASWPSVPATSTRKPLATDQTRQPKRSVIAEAAIRRRSVVALLAVRVGLQRKAARRRAIDLSACRGGLVDQQHRQAVPRSRERGAAACRPGADHDQVERELMAPARRRRCRNLEPRHDRHHAGLAQLAADPHQALLAHAHEAEGAARRARVAGCAADGRRPPPSALRPASRPRAPRPAAPSTRIVTFAPRCSPSMRTAACSGIGCMPVRPPLYKPRLAIHTLCRPAIEGRRPAAACFARASGLRGSDECQSIGWPGS